MTDDIAIYSWVGRFMHSRIGKLLYVTSPLRLALFILGIHLIFIFSFGILIQADVQIINLKYQINFQERVEFLMITISFFIYTPTVWWFFSSQLTFIPSIYQGLRENHVIDGPRSGYASLDLYIKHKLLTKMQNRTWKINAFLLGVLFFGAFFWSMYNSPILEKWFMNNPVCYSIYGISTVITIYMMIVATIRQISFTRLIRSLNVDFNVVISPLSDDIGGLSPIKDLISKLFFMAAATGIWVNMVLLMKPISMLLYLRSDEINPYTRLWDSGWLAFIISSIGMFALLLTLFLLGPYIILTTLRSLRSFLLTAKQTELRLVSARFNNVFRWYQDYLAREPLNNLKKRNDVLIELRQRSILINNSFPNWPFSFRWIGGFSLITVLSFLPIIQSLVELVKLLIPAAPSGQ